jgi:hypothetical protein
MDIVPETFWHKDLLPDSLETKLDRHDIKECQPGDVAPADLRSLDNGHLE